MMGLKASSCAALHLSTATARSPCLPSETCTSFQANDTIWYAVGVIHVDNVSVWSLLQKSDNFLLWFFFLYSLSLTITGILGEFIAEQLKLIISARHSKYKRNDGILSRSLQIWWFTEENGEQALELRLFICVDLKDKSAKQACS